MPKPIVCLSTALRQYSEAFRHCFTKRQWKYFVIVLLGLIECDERRTLRGFQAAVGEQVSLCGLSRFFNRWQWSENQIAQSWLSRFRQQMKPLVEADHHRQEGEREKQRGRPKATVVTGYLILDDSVHVKPQGRKMESIGKHYSSTERRVVNGHCLFSGLYVLLGRRCPLQPRLYRQQAVCEQEGVPFLSKIDLAIQEIEQFEPVIGAHTHLLIDIWFYCRSVRKTAQKRGWDVSGGLKSNRKLRWQAEDGTHQWITLTEYAAHLQPEDWQEAIWPSDKGGQKVYVHAVRTWVHKLGPTLVLISCRDINDSHKSLRFWGSTMLKEDAQTLVNTLAVRWDIEVLFEDAKDLLGSDHYQLMSAEAIVRFWTLIACVCCFLEEQRTAQESLISWGDARRAVQKEHQCKSGLSSEQIAVQLTLFNS